MAEDFTVDASVWVGAADDTDAFHAESSTFLAAAVANESRLIVPAFAVVEVACALARKFSDAPRGRRMGHDVRQGRGVTYVAVDDVLLAAAEQIGTIVFLRGADALYAATAQLTGTTLVSWDNELIQRAGATAPTTWLDAGS
jgi:predicted nucleic acid-binding protein